MDGGDAACITRIGLFHAGGEGMGDGPPERSDRPQKTAAQPPDDSALGRPPHPPNPVRNPMRQMFMVNDVQNRWPFALRAAACVAVPALIGWLAGDLAFGFQGPLELERPERNR